MIKREQKKISFLYSGNNTKLSHLHNDQFLVAHKYCQRCQFANPMIPQGDISAPVLFVGKTFNVTLNDDLFFQSTLSVLGLSKSDVLYIGAIGCILRKDLTEEEMCSAMEQCFVWKQELLKRATNMQYVILSGMHAYQLFYGHVERLSDYLGYIFESTIGERTVKVIPIPSPVYLSRNPAAFKKTLDVLREMKSEVCLKRL